jgi:hypothetical protein
MSHFTRLKTQMVEKDYLVRALKDLGYTCQDGPVRVRGVGTAATRADLKVATRSPKCDIGFRRTKNGYEVVADWWGITDVKEEAFVQQLTQRYAYHAARAKLAEQGFDLVTEETQKDGQIHLVLRRMA